MTMPLANLAPVVGIGMKTMIDVDGRDGRTASLCSRGVQGIKQRHAIGAAGKRHPPVWRADHTIGKWREKFAQRALTPLSVPVGHEPPVARFQHGVGVHRGQAVNLLQQVALEPRSHCLGITVGAAQWLRYRRINDAQLLELG
jgi:hypothetical protein